MRKKFKVIGSIVIAINILILVIGNVSYTIAGPGGGGDDTCPYTSPVKTNTEPHTGQYVCKCSGDNAYYAITDCIPKDGSLCSAINCSKPSAN